MSSMLLLVPEHWMTMVISFLYKMKTDFYGMLLVQNHTNCMERMGWVERASLWGEYLMQLPLIDHYVFLMTAGGFFGSISSSGLWFEDLESNAWRGVSWTLATVVPLADIALLVSIGNCWCPFCFLSYLYNSFLVNKEDSSTSLDLYEFLI